MEAMDMGRLIVAQRKQVRRQRIRAIAVSLMLLAATAAILVAAVRLGR